MMSKGDGNEYRILHMISGDILIGKLYENGKFGVVLDKVMSVHIGDNYMVYMNVYMDGLSNSTRFYFAASHIISIGSVHSKIEKLYLKTWDKMNELGEEVFEDSIDRNNITIH